MLAERKTGQFIRLTANKSFWGGAPKIDELVFRVFNNQDAMVQGLKKGEVDFVDGLEANVFESLKDTPGVTRVKGAYSGFDELAMNVGAALDDGTPIGDGHPALKDKRVRQAIAHAVDRKALVTRVLRGNGTEATGVIPSIYGSLLYTPGPEEVYNFDLAAGKKILEDAGYKDTDGNGVREMPGGGRPLELRLFSRRESPSSQQSVQFMQGWLKELGIATKVSVLEENRLTEIIGQGEFDLFEWGWVVEPDPNYQLSTFLCSSRSYKDEAGKIAANLSDSFYCNPKFDKLYEQQNTTIDRAKRADIVKQMQGMLYRDAPYVVTYYYDELQAYRSDRFTGLQPQPDPNGVLLFQWGRHSYETVQPVVASSGDGAGGGGGSGLALGLVAAVVVAAGLGVFFWQRSRTSRDERE